MKFPDLVEAIAALGADGIDVNEIYMGLSPNPDPSVLRSSRRLCESFGLRITSCWFWADMLAAVTMESFESALAHATRYLAIAEILHAPCITITNGHLPPGLEATAAHSILMRLYEQLLPRAEDHGVMIGLEAGRAGTPFNSPQGVLSIVNAFESRFLTVTPDFESWRRPTQKMGARYIQDSEAPKGEPLSVEVFREVLPYSPYIHAKFLEFDESGTDPNYPIDDIFAAVRAEGGDHTFTIEYEGWIPDIHPERDSRVETAKAIALIRRQFAPQQPVS
jgi:hypothetical protein